MVLTPPFLCNEPTCNSPTASVVTGRGLPITPTAGLEFEF